EDGGLLAYCERGDVGLLRPVDPPARVVLQEVEDTVQLHVGETRLERGTHALQSFERDLAQIGQCQRRITGRHAPVTPRPRDTGTGAAHRRGTRPRGAATSPRRVPGC